MIELVLDAGASRRVLRVASLAGRRTAKRPRSGPVETVWYRHADAGLVPTRDGKVWRLERICPGAPGAGRTELVATADHPEALGHGIEPSPVARAAFSGRWRRSMLAPAAAGGAPAVVTVFVGRLRDVARERTACRVRLEGDDAADLAALALGLIIELGATPATEPLALEPVGSEDAEPAPPALPAPDPAADVDEAIGAILGGLGTVLLHWAPLAMPERGVRPVHQMRVTVRRLRSALLAFREVLGRCLDPERDGLRELAAALGAARDWDVFLGGTVPEIEGALPDGTTLSPLRVEAEAARADAYRALRARLDGADTRRLLATFALLPFSRPWTGHASDPEAGAGAPGTADPGPAGTLASMVPLLVEKRFRRLVRKRRTLDGMPPGQLHDARKAAKTLRYTLEFLGGALPERDARKLVKRLGSLQDALGAINDAETGTRLMHDAARHGADPHASGIVVGWLAAERARRRDDLDALWSAVRRTDRFWRL